MILDRVIKNRVDMYNPFGFVPKELIGTLVGAGLSVASSVIGGMASAKANAKAEQEMKAQNARNNAWYNRRYNEDYLDTAAGQNLVRQAREYADKNWKRQQGAQAVGGGTDAATAMAKEAGNRMIGDTMANIASADVQRKDNVDRIHQQQENAYSQQQVALAQQKANNIAQVASGTSDAMMNAGSAYDTYISTGDITKKGH